MFPASAGIRGGVGLLGCLLAVSAGLLGAPPESLLAWAGGEVYGHLWVQHWQGIGLPAWQPGTDLALGAERWPVLDPLITVVVASFSSVFGATHAWNFMVMGFVTLAFAGGWRLARAEGGDPLTGAVALALSAPFLGSLASGLTEDGALGLGALGLSLSVGAVRETHPWRAGLLGGACLALLAGCGLYLMWAFSMLALALGIPRLRHSSERGPLMLAALLAAVGGVAALSHQGSERLEIAQQAHAQGGLGFEPLWQLNPWRQTDLASLLWPGPPELLGDEILRLHPSYLGWSLLLLALWGGRSRWWWVLLLSLGFSLGEALRWMGSETGLSNPLHALLMLLPGADHLHHLGRLNLISGLALAVLAARGAQRLLPSLRWLIPLLILSEGLLLSPSPLPLPLAPGALHEHWSLPEPGEGRLLVVPSAGPGVHPQYALYAQRAHGRRLALDPNRPGRPLQEAGPLAAWLQSLSHGPPTHRATPGDLARLQSSGITTVLVLEPYIRQVEESLGSPSRSTKGGACWELDQITLP